VGDTTQVALVRRLSGGNLVLYVGAGTGRVDRLEPVELNTRNVGEVGQPVWLPGDPELGLLLVRGQLFTFRAAAIPLGAVDNAPTGITAFAVPPDARRLAYVQRGKLHVAALKRDGGLPTLGDGEEVPTSLTDLTAVGWSQQDWLVIAGKQRADSRVVVHDITVDGAAQAPPRDGEWGTKPVVHLVASADDPVNGRGGGQVMYVANGLAYELFSEQRLLTASDVAGATPSPGTSQTADAGAPTSPFFLD
jgi:hypothetical protein